MVLLAERQVRLGWLSLPLARHWRGFERALDARIAEAAIAPEKDDFREGSGGQGGLVVLC